MTVVASDLEGTLSAGEMWRGISEYRKLHDARAVYRRFFLGRMPGFVASKLGVIDSQAFKIDWSVRLARFFAASGELAVAYGDTYDDLPMLSPARQSVAVCPDKRLEAVLRQRGWRIVSGQPIVISRGFVLVCTTRYLRSTSLNASASLRTPSRILRSSSAP